MAQFVRGSRWWLIPVCLLDVMSCALWALHVGYQAAKKMQNGGCVDGGDAKMTMKMRGLFLRLRRKCRIGGCVVGGDEKN